MDAIDNIKTLIFLQRLITITITIIYLTTLSFKSTSACSKYERALNLQLYFIISSIKNIYIYSIIYVHMNIKSYKNKKKLKI